MSAARTRGPSQRILLVQNKAAVSVFVASLIYVGAAASGCSSDSNVPGVTGDANAGGANAGGATGTNAGGANAGGANAGGNMYTGSGGAPTNVATCQGKIYACGELLDNDGDGLIDSQDPDCLGLCDNTEDSYCGGIPGQNSAPCKMDRYFGQDTGSGNDDCYWSHKVHSRPTAATASGVASSRRARATSCGSAHREQIEPRCARRPSSTMLPFATHVNRSPLASTTVGAASYALARPSCPPIAILALAVPAPVPHRTAPLNSRHADSKARTHACSTRIV